MIQSLSRTDFLSIAHVSSYLKIDPIKTKVCYAVEKIFHYLHSNRYAITVALWSYISINVGIALSHSEGDQEYNLDFCQEKICEYWNNRASNQTNTALPNIELKCNSSYPNYHPFRSLNKCVNNLCKYSKTVKENLPICSTFKYFNEIAHLWNQFCPKKPYKLRMPSG